LESREQQLAAREPFLKYSRLIVDSEREPHARSIEALNYKNRQAADMGR
jgi:hypothetical protein